MLFLIHILYIFENNIFDNYTYIYSSQLNENATKENIYNSTYNTIIFIIALYVFYIYNCIIYIYIFI